jgi:hypothetical protein
LFEHDTSRTEHRHISTLEYKQYDKKFVNFNRRWRIHRPALVALLEIRGLLDKGYVSLGKTNEPNDNWEVFYDHKGNLLGHTTATISGENMDEVKTYLTWAVEALDKPISTIDHFPTN